MKSPLLSIGLLATLILFCNACVEEFGPEYDFFDGNGKKPVYISYEELGDIRNIEPQPTYHTGPIFLLGDLFFMVENGKGIHVIDISFPANPVEITFIKIPAVTDFTISGKTLFADNGPNLVSIDITDLTSIVVLNVESNVFDPILFPPLYSGYFECVDPDKGVVVDWIDAQLDNAKCRTFN